MQLMNKKVLVTGATGGIGSVLCKLLVAQGCQLIFTCVDAALLEKLQGELGSAHIAVQADISSDEGRAKIVAMCEEDDGIDAVINLAGILNFQLFENQSPSLISATVGINMLAPMMLCHDLIKVLKNKSESAILNVGSIFGSIGHPGFVAYCASKGGMKSFSEALSRELADTPICVSYIAPRATSTKLNSTNIEKLNKALGNKSDSPEFVAGKIVEVLQSGKRLKYLGWPEKFFVRVNALFPGIVHGALVKKLSLIKQHIN